MESENNALSVDWPDTITFTLKVAGVSRRKSVLLCFGREEQYNIFLTKSASCVFEVLNESAAQFQNSALEMGNEGKHKPGTAVTGGTKIIYIFMWINKDNYYFLLSQLLLPVISYLFILMLFSIDTGEVILVYIV